MKKGRIKKGVLSIILSIALAAMLGGCGNTGGNNKTALAQNGDEEEPLSIVIENRTENAAPTSDGAGGAGAAESIAKSQAASEAEAVRIAESQAASQQTKVNGRLVYLTFDDGPSYLTPQVLDILDRYNVKATFFVTYTTDPALVPYYNEIVRRGHTIGIHTATHQYDAIYASMEAFTADFNQIYDYVKMLTGVSCQFYRFPGGSLTGRNAAIREQIKQMMVQRGLVYHDWNVVTGDGGTVTADEAYHNVVDNILPRSHPVILAHDGAKKETTVQALPGIIETLQSWGYVFAPLTPDVVPIQQGINW